MKFVHFVKFANAMLIEKMQELENGAWPSEKLPEMKYVNNCIATATECSENELDLLALATDMCMFDYINKWAVCKNSELHVLAMQYAD